MYCCDNIKEKVKIDLRKEKQPTYNISSNLSSTAKCDYSILYNRSWRV